MIFAPAFICAPREGSSQAMSRILPARSKSLKLCEGRTAATIHSTVVLSISSRLIRSPTRASSPQTGTINATRGPSMAFISLTIRKISSMFPQMG